MISLRQLQEDFQNQLLGTHNSLEQHISEPHKGKITDRIGVYSYAYSARLVEILAADFPMLKKLMGEKTFHAMGHTYVQAQPSQHYSIAEFGQHLNHFLKTTTPYQEKPAIAEMALLEWSINKATIAANAPVLTMVDMQKVPQSEWPNIRLTLHPSVAILQFTHTIPEIWKDLDSKKFIGKPKAKAYKQAVNYAVWRYELIAQFSVLPLHEAWMLQAFNAGQNFTEICETLCEKFDDEEQAAQYAIGCILRWLNDGLLSSVRWDSL